VKASLFVGGASLGLLVGLLAGLSASPVVASLTSALTGIVVGYATARIGGSVRKNKGATGPVAEDEGGGWTASGAAVQHYLTGFSVVAALATMVGLYARTHNWFSPTPEEIVNSWVKAGLTPAQGRQVALNVLNTQLDLTQEPLFNTPKDVFEAWVGAGLDKDAASELTKSLLGGVPRLKEMQPIKSSEPEPEDKSAKNDAKSKAKHDASRPSFVLSVLIDSARIECDDLMGKVRTQQWQLVEDKFQENGGKWKKFLEDARKLPESERHAKLAAYATRCLALGRI